MFGPGLQYVYNKKRCLLLNDKRLVQEREFIRHREGPFREEVAYICGYISNLGRIRLFNAVNLEQGYGLIEIRTPKEVLYEEDV